MVNTRSANKRTYSGVPERSEGLLTAASPPGSPHGLCGTPDAVAVDVVGESFDIDECLADLEKFPDGDLPQRKLCRYLEKCPAGDLLDLLRSWSASRPT